MKKIFFLLTIMCLMPIRVVLATTSSTPVSNNLTFNECVNFQDDVKSYATQGYFGHCKKATCYTGKWEVSYYISNDMIRCQNGNTNKYFEVYKNGCSRYSGSCTPSSTVNYCSMVIYYDCSRVKSGAKYQYATTKTTTKKTTTITKKKTTTTTKKKTTTKKTTTTTKKNVTVPKTDVTTPVIDPTTEPTTVDSAFKNNFLSSIELSVGELVFSKLTTNYTIEVPIETTSITVKAIPENPESKVVIENNEEIDPDVPITITVTAPSQDVRVYKINVKYPKDVSTTDNTLADLKIEGYKLDFNKNTYEYTLKVDKNVNELKIDATPSSDKAKIEIQGNSELKNKSEIQIIVTPEEGQINYYTIKIKKSTNIILYIIIFIVIGLVIYIGLKLFRKLFTKNGEENYDYEYE